MKTKGFEKAESKALTDKRRPMEYRSSDDPAIKGNTFEQNQQAKSNAAERAARNALKNDKEVQGLELEARGDVLYGPDDPMSRVPENAKVPTKSDMDFSLAELEKALKDAGFTE